MLYKLTLLNAQIEKLSLMSQEMELEKLFIKLPKSSSDKLKIYSSEILKDNLIKIKWAPIFLIQKIVTLKTLRIYEFFLLSYRQLHFLIYEEYRELDLTFGFQIFLSVVFYSFLHLTSSSFDMYDAIMADRENTSVEVINASILLSLVTYLFYGAKLLLFCSICSKVVLEVNRIHLYTKKAHKACFSFPFC